MTGYRRIAALALAAALPGRSAADFLAPSVAGGFAWDRPVETSSASAALATFQAWDFFSYVSIADPDTGLPATNAPNLVYGSNTGSPFAATTVPYYGFGGIDPNNASPPAGAVWQPVNTAGPANAYDSNAAASGSIVTGGGFGNIYSASGVVMPRVIVPNNKDGVAGDNPTGTTVIVVQVRTLINAADPTSFVINGQSVAPFQATLLTTAQVPAGPGFFATRAEWLYTFYVDGNADTYQIDFSSAGAGMSLDRLAVDTYWSPTTLAPAVIPVPEPGYTGLMAVLGSAGVWLARGFRRPPYARRSGL